MLCFCGIARDSAIRHGLRFGDIEQIGALSHIAGFSFLGARSFQSFSVNPQSC